MLAEPILADRFILLFGPLAFRRLQAKIANGCRREALEATLAMRVLVNSSVRQFISASRTSLID
jgi:hypothetical protein